MVTSRSPISVSQRMYRISHGLCAERQTTLHQRLWLPRDTTSPWIGEQYLQNTIHESSIDILQVVTGYLDFRNALRLHTILGWRITGQDLREHLEGTSKISSLHPPR